MPRPQLPNGKLFYSQNGGLLYKYREKFEEFGRQCSVCSQLLPHACFQKGLINKSNKEVASCCYCRAKTCKYDEHLPIPYDRAEAQQRAGSFIATIKQWVKSKPLPCTKRKTSKKKFISPTFAEISTFAQSEKYWGYRIALHLRMHGDIKGFLCRRKFPTEVSAKLYLQKMVNRINERRTDVTGARDLVIDN